VPHELKEGPDSIELSLTAGGREELFRAALEGVLAAAYPKAPEGKGDGQVVPVQAAGADDETLLAGLVEDTLRAIREEPGTLLPPRWLAFDEHRVTANLPLLAPKAESRALALADAALVPAESGVAARLELVPGAGR
jgi:hypothetical protein